MFIVRNNRIKVYDVYVKKLVIYIYFTNRYKGLDSKHYRFVRGFLEKE